MKIEDISGNKTAVFDKFVTERWGKGFSFKTYRYMASYYLKKISFKGKRVLDIGYGNGLMLCANSLLSDPALAVGLDNFMGEGSPASDYEFAKRFRSSLGLLNTMFAIGDALHLPFKKNSFDIVYAGNFLHHIYVSTSHLRKDKSENLSVIIKLLRDIYEILSDQGVFIVWETPRYSLLRIFLGLFRFSRGVSYETKQEPADWIYALEKAGFKDFRVEFYTPYPLRFFRKLISTRIGRYFGSIQYYIFSYKKISTD